MRISHSFAIVGALLALSCAGNEGTVAVDAQWNLTCPSESSVDCGSLGETCLGAIGQRATDLLERFDLKGMGHLMANIYFTHSCTFPILQTRLKMAVAFLKVSLGEFIY